MDLAQGPPSSSRPSLPAVVHDCFFSLARTGAPSWTFATKSQHDVRYNRAKPVATASPCT
eukprot:5527852-Pleurochrysis_carterae.AAC.2